MKKVVAIIEKTSEGRYGIYLPSIDGITGFGNSVDEAKEDLQSAIKETVEFCKDTGRDTGELDDGNLNIEYKYDLSGFFLKYNIFNVSALAKLIGINPSLLRQYKQGNTYISEEQKEKIMTGIHSLANELSTVRF